MRSSTPVEPDAVEPTPSAPRPIGPAGSEPRARLTRRRWLLLLAVIFVSGCAGRVTHAVESATMFVPSRAAFATPEFARDVTVQVGERGTMHGWWLDASPGVPSKGTILFCHGNSGNMPDHLPFVERLPSLGYDVFMFDYRGYGRSSRPRQINRHSLLRDAKAAHDHLLSKGVNPDRPFVVLGHSMGSAISVALAAERPGAFDAVVLVSPFSSFPRVASDFTGPLGWLLIPRGLAPEKQAARLGDTPLLLIHGGRDRIVRPYHSRRIAEATAQAGVATTLRESPDAGHNDVFDEPFGTIEAIEVFIGSLRLDDPAATTTADPAQSE